jgi:hypothetical protein
VNERKRRSKARLLTRNDQPMGEGIGRTPSFVARALLNGPDPVPTGCVVGTTVQKNASAYRPAIGAGSSSSRSPLRQSVECALVAELEDEASGEITRGPGTAFLDRVGAVEVAPRLSLPDLLVVENLNDTGSRTDVSAVWMVEAH